MTPTSSELSYSIIAGIYFSMAASLVLLLSQCYYMHLKHLLIEVQFEWRGPGAIGLV